SLPRDVIIKTQSIIANRDLTLLAKELLQHQDPDPEEIGILLTKHHEILRDSLECSTPKIEKMIQAANRAGAYGSKIVGSGSGGCMIAFAPNAPEKVLETIRNTGANAFSVKML
ncbi:MAG: GHMP kinase, partial [Candidatus Hodarchaeota archaeon]